MPPKATDTEPTTGTIEPARELGARDVPKFGDWIRGNFASERNPIRDGMYVETIRNTGRLNHGTFYRLTDGRGKFWMFEAKNTTRLPAPISVPTQPAQPVGGDGPVSGASDMLVTLLLAANFFIGWLQVQS